MSENSFPVSTLSEIPIEPFFARYIIGRKVRSIEGISKGNDETDLVLINDSPFTKKIRKHTILGRFNKVEILDLIKNEKELSEFVHKNIDSETVNSVTQSTFTRPPRRGGLDSNLLTSEKPLVLISSPNYKTVNDLNLTQLNNIKTKVGNCTMERSENGKHKPNFKQITRSFNKLRRRCKALGIIEVSFPKISNRRHQLAKIINKTFIDHGVNCTVYTNKETIGQIDESFSFCKDIIKLQNEDKHISSIKEKLKLKKIKGYIIENDILLKIRKCRNKIYKQLVIPQCLKRDILEMCHDHFFGAHLGHEKTWAKISSRFY
ncbi:hypothetical protein BpHYR1_000558 [Brachionus plicatilis]|uniref:Integrase zinc-binding domain-containing protein n=1 Tax=Brachionus plicatilis TaxID=10195 RepID=A0A3M7R4G9_BRAPC|nr:hypothetical protein BpHYR1_000558 [Brachionus plicatilis]